MALNLSDLPDLSGGRVTYRQLDSWARQRSVFDLGDRACPGSGNPRMLSEAEAEAILDLAIELDRIYSGAYFAARVAFHEAHGVHRLDGPSCTTCTHPPVAHIVEPSPTGGRPRLSCVICQTEAAHRALAAAHRAFAEETAR